MAVHSQRILSLCSGVGWLDLGLKLGLSYFDVASQVVGYCERESYAVSVLLARMAEASLEPAPISDDFGDFDERWRGRVDWVVAGFPCQPWSAAGKQEGTADERWIWPQIADLIRRVGSPNVFLENVPGLISGGGLTHVLSDLAEMGFNAEWASVTAESVGAAHKRERVFILAMENAECGGGGTAIRDAYLQGRRDARDWKPHLSQASERGVGEYNSDDRLASEVLGNAGSLRASESRQSEARQSEQQQGRAGESGGRREFVGDAECCGGRIDKSGRGSHRRAAAGRSGAAVADPSSSSSKGERPDNATQRWQDARRSIGLCDGASVFAPGPSADWSSIPEALWPATEPGLRVLVDGRTVVLDESRADQLRCGGNGVVVVQAAAAFVELMRRTLNTQ